MFNRNCLAKKLNMIPKYILKEVLFYKEKHKDQTEITRLVLNKNYIEYTSEVTGNPYNYITHDKINIYELSNLCKTWAHSNGYWLSVRLYEPNGFNIVVFSHIHSQLQKDLKEINDKTEPEAVFKACQWILG